jgi:hypothetical protein
MSGRVAGRSVIITGAGSGVGRADYLTGQVMMVDGGMVLV